MMVFLFKQTLGHLDWCPEAQNDPPPLSILPSNIYPDEPTYAESVARKCAPLARFRDTVGNLPEPDWYACIGVATHCADGEIFAHEYSSGYGGYTFKETQARLDRAKNFGPTTCTHFQSINPIGCEGCQYRRKITSPIQLGRQTVRKREATAGQDSSATTRGPPHAAQAVIPHLMLKLAGSHDCPY